MDVVGVIVSLHYLARAHFAARKSSLQKILAGTKRMKWKSEDENPIIVTGRVSNYF